MDWAELEEDFLRITREIVWATVASVDTQGRPRNRMLHPYWEVVDGTPVLGRDEPVAAEGEAPGRDPLRRGLLLVRQAGDRQRRVQASRAPDQNERVWQLFLDAEPPLGYDPGDMPQWKDGPIDSEFEALRLDPWRVMLLSAEDAATRNWYQRVWRP